MRRDDGMFLEQTAKGNAGPAATAADRNEDAKRQEKAGSEEHRSSTASPGSHGCGPGKGI
jgi:hypothetical protein